ncbi:MAG TPA: alpha-amylase family glycosyl hydrolase [Steroidobacteraceae bacterium]|nr:alpha-amylase family glycosyl hydrolase [Steroidobacteraceae bacterium]
MKNNTSTLRLGVCLLLAVTTLAVSPARAADAAAGSARHSPDWLRDAVIYEIFPRAFSREGNFKGIVPQLDRLKAQGVTVIWLMPIHPVGKLKAKGSLGSPYAVRDYDAINPEYGTGDDLKQLVAAAHQRGIKVFIDVVINHTSWDSVLLTKHADWYTHDASGNIVPPNPDWVDVADLDWSKPGLRQYMTGMLVRWLRDYGLDGFRCDYASGVPTDFWEHVRPELDKVRPGLAFLAESDDPALLRSAFDIDYAWDFYHAMSDALAGAKPASELRAVWERAAAKYPPGALRLRFSDNHDQLRTTGQAGLPAAMAASAVMFTLDGVPLLYNGMEVGDTVESLAPALFERAPIQWEVAERRPRVSAWYRQLAALRREHAALTRGDVQWLGNSDPQRILSYRRTTSDESIAVVVNLSSTPFSGTVDAGPAGHLDITPGAVSPGGSQAVASLPNVSLGPWEFRVFRRQ